MKKSLTDKELNKVDGGSSIPAEFTIHYPFPSRIPAEFTIHYQCPECGSVILVFAKGIGDWHNQPAQKELYCRNCNKTLICQRLDF